LGPSAVLVLEVQDALAQSIVEVAMPHEVHHMGLMPAQPGSEPRDRGARQSVDGDQPGLQLWLERIADASPLGLDVELDQVDGGGDHDEHPQGSVDGDGARCVWQVEEADNRCALGLGDEAVGARVVQQLPGETRDGRRIVEEEPESQSFGVSGAHLVEAALPGQGDFACEHRLEQRAAEIHGGLLVAGCPDPTRARAPRVELEEQDLQSLSVEGQLELHARCPVQRELGDARPVTAFSHLLEEQVEVQIAPDAHERPLHARIQTVCRA
jgi:hypothetical protein